MPKYYVKSGEVSVVVSAIDAEGAALGAIHRNADLPEVVEADFCDDDSCEDTDWQDMLPEWAREELADTIEVSERGMGRSDAGRFATDDAMTKYGQLLVAVERLLGL